MIRLLPDTLVNQIAAGEVIERPAAALKELVENALDAGATQIDVTLRKGGKSYISVRDNGCGMGPDDLKLALMRHATSKLPDGDLVHIHTMGFRGEALPSIASVARLTLTSRRADDDHAWVITAESGAITPPAPASAPPGTHAEIADLFFLTPARLKFMKADMTEYAACKDMIIRLALARPDVGFTLTHEGRSIFSLPSECKNDENQNLAMRVRDLMGHEFHDNTVIFDVFDRDIALSGRIGIPTYHKGQATHQYLFVNGRPVKDRVLLGSLRAAYGDVMPHGRHPVALIYLSLPPDDVDVNVHPGKAEVRFREPGRIRSLMIGAIRTRLSPIQGTSTTLSSDLQGRIQKNLLGYAFSPFQQMDKEASSYQGALYDSGDLPYHPVVYTAPVTTPARLNEGSMIDFSSDATPLGYAIAQIHNAFILAQTRDGLVIVDQHAAHERLTYERYKRDMETHGIPSQTLLTPDIVPLDDVRADLILSHADHFTRYGLVVDSFGADCILIRAIPADLAGQVDIAAMITDLADEIAEKHIPTTLEDRILRYLATRACHRSVRAGQALTVSEMNALLREIERTPNAMQCNHGRPSVIHLRLSDLENLFERT